MYVKSICSVFAVLVAVFAQHVVEAKPVTPNYDAAAIGVKKSQDQVRRGNGATVGAVKSTAGAQQPQGKPHAETGTLTDSFVGSDGVVRDGAGNPVGKVMPGNQVIGNDGNPTGLRVVSPRDEEVVIGPDEKLVRPAQHAETDVCVPSKTLSTEEANRIAWGKIGDFANACSVGIEDLIAVGADGREVEGAFTVKERGRISVGAQWNPEKFLTTVIHIHSHPIGAYSTWPSWNDVKGAYYRSIKITQMLEDKKCDPAVIYERKFYHYIVVCPREGEPVQLLRYDKESVYKVAQDGSETDFYKERPSFVDDPAITWAPDGHNPFRYRAVDIAKVLSEIQKDEETSSSGTGAALSGGGAGANCACKSEEGVGVRGWCTCTFRSAHVTLGNLFRMGTDLSVADYSYLICSECYKCRKDLNDVECFKKEGPLCIWDGKVARENGVDGKTSPQGEALKRLVEAQERILKIPDGEIVIPGLCHCRVPDKWELGMPPSKILMCKKCGKPRSAIPASAKNPRRPHRLRRCIKTPIALFVCVCAGETGIRPELSTSPYDDGEVQLHLICTECSKVKYHAFASMREFKSKFANAKPDGKALVEFLIGTADVKAALAEADAEMAAINASKQE